VTDRPRRHTAHLTARIPPTLMDRASLAAEIAGLPRSALVRRALERETSRILAEAETDARATLRDGEGIRS